MRCFVFLNLLLSALLAGAAPAGAAAPPAVELGRLESGVAVRQAGDALSVVEDGQVLFEFRVVGWSSPDTVHDLPAPRARAFGWSFPHLRDILFLDVSAGRGLAAGAALEFSGEAPETLARSVRPHDGTGDHPPRAVRYWQRIIDRADGREYVALVRLDGARVEPRDGSDLYAFDGGRERDEELLWPLAVVRASTERELQMRLGRALLAFDGAGERAEPDQWWRVPALCGLCQQQRVSEVELDLQDRDSSLLLRVRTQVEYPDHARASAEGMSIDGVPLAHWLSGEQEDEAWFVVPLDAPLADTLFDVAVSGDARVEARLSTGRTVVVPTVRVRLDPAFEDRLATLESAAEPEKFPNHLAAGLVSSWPNPFRDSTTIEVTVPATIDEAFELTPELAARVEPGAEPPFGTSPTVLVKVYNVSGQLVNVLDEGPRTAGRFTVGWNGQDLQGRPVASGAYYVHVEMDEWSVTRRVLLLRN